MSDRLVSLAATAAHCRDILQSSSHTSSRPPHSCHPPCLLTRLPLHRFASISFPPNLLPTAFRNHLFLPHTHPTTRPLLPLPSPSAAGCMLLADLPYAE